MLDIRPIFDLAFWFRLQPIALSPVFHQGFFLFFSILLVAGAVARVVARRKTEDRLLSRLYRKIANFMLTSGLLGFVWFFFTFEEAYLIGARFWLLVLAIGAIVWMVNIVKFARVTIPQERERIALRSEGNKYLPRRSR